MISVIVPVYNAEKKLSRCINSILEQSYKDIELLLIDDGSTDSSALICKRYENIDNRVRYIYKTNGGAASARNKGIQEARGEYIQFVDSDDYISPMMSELLIHSMQRDKSDLTICGFMIISPYASNEIVYKEAEGISIKEFESFVNKYYNQSIIHSCWNKLYKKNLIHNYMNSDYKWGEDYIFNLGYLKNSNLISVVNRPLYHYDCTDDSVTRGVYQKQYDYIKERYNLSIDYLDEIFHSDKINSMVSYRYMCEIFADIYYTTDFFNINKTLVNLILSENSNAIDRIHRVNDFSEAITRREIKTIILYLRKEKLRYCLKRLIKRFVSLVKH